jgi:hypothetical protein
MDLGICTDLNICKQSQHTPTHTDTHTHQHTHTTHTHTHTHTHTDTPTHIDLNICTDLYIHSFKHAYIHTHTSIHTSNKELDKDPQGIPQRTTLHQNMLYYVSKFMRSLRGTHQCGCVYKGSNKKQPQRHPRLPSILPLIFLSNPT